jgi:hypothetical protein
MCRLASYLVLLCAFIFTASAAYGIPCGSGSGDGVGDSGDGKVIECDGQIAQDTRTETSFYPEPEVDRERVHETGMSVQRTNLSVADAGHLTYTEEVAATIAPEDVGGFDLPSLNIWFLAIIGVWFVLSLWNLRVLSSPTKNKKSTD